MFPIPVDHKKSIHKKYFMRTGKTSQLPQWLLHSWSEEKNVNLKLCNTPAGRSNSISLERSACLQEVQDVTSCRKRALLGDSVYQQNIVLIRKHKISWERKLCRWNRIQSRDLTLGEPRTELWFFLQRWFHSQRTWSASMGASKGNPSPQPSPPPQISSPS